MVSMGKYTFKGENTLLAANWSGSFTTVDPC